MKRKSSGPGQAVAACIGLVCMGLGAAAWAAPNGFKFQGRLTDPAGVNRDGVFAIRFSIHDQAAGGDLLWAKTLSAVAVRNGEFQVVLADPPDSASQPGLAAVFTGNPRFLQIRVLSGPGISAPEAPIVARRQLASTPFAPKAAAAAPPIPAGAILMFLSACPPGFAEVAALRNRVPIGADTASVDPDVPDVPDAAGGAKTHSHGIASHAPVARPRPVGYGYPYGIQYPPADAAQRPGPDITDPTTTLPPFLTVIFCQKQ